MYSIAPMHFRRTHSQRESHFASHRSLAHLIPFQRRLYSKIRHETTPNVTFQLCPSDRSRIFNPPDPIPASIHPTLRHIWRRWICIFGHLSKGKGQSVARIIKGRGLTLTKVYTRHSSCRPNQDSVICEDLVVIFLVSKSSEAA